MLDDAMKQRLIELSVIILVVFVWTSLENLSKSSVTVNIICNSLRQQVFYSSPQKNRIAYVLKHQKSCTIGKNASSTLPSRKPEKHVNNFDQCICNTTLKLTNKKTVEVFIFNFLTKL